MNDVSSLVEKTVADALRASGVGGVLLGISGGADSSALLLALLAAGVDVKAVHCNFHLRGEESDRDMRHVEELCSSLNVALEIVDFDVERYVGEHGVSVEMGCRELRYDYFRRRMSECGLQRIAVAHNSDDNVETMLLNLFRGTGLRGLRGMLEDTGEIIRPLLSVSRKEIEAYLAEKNVGFVVDSTNSESDYKRNFLRNEVLPMLESRWPGLRRSLGSTMSNLRMEEIALDRLESRTLGEDPDFLSWENIEECPGADWIIRRFCARHEMPRAVTLEVIASYARNGRRSRGKRWRFPAGFMAFGANGLYFRSAGKETDCLGENDLISFFDIERHEIDDDLKSRIRRAPNTEVWLPLPPEDCRLRYARKGDRISPLGMHGSKAVSEVIKESGVSPLQKERIIVLEDKATGEILWIEGMKRSRKKLITDKSVAAWRIFRKNFAD